MNLSTILYFIAVVLTFLLTGFLAWVAWRTKPLLPGVRAYAALALGECLLALDEIFMMVSATQGQAHFWFNLRFLFSGAIAVFFLVFALEYHGRKDWLTRPLVAGAFIIPLLSQFFIWTNSLYGMWVKQEVGFHQNGPFWIADTSVRIPGVWFLVHSFYSLALLLAGLVVILLVAWRKRQELRGQALLLAAGALVALITSLIPVFNLFPRLAFNPFIPGIGISAGLYALAVFRFQFLKRSPAPEGVGTTPRFQAHEHNSLVVFIFIFILFATGIAAIGFVSYQKYEDQFRLQVNGQLTAVAALKVNGLESWRTERLGDASMFSGNPAFAALAQQYFANPADTQAQGQLQAWMADFQNYYHYDGVFLLDTRGEVRISAPATAGPPGAYLAGQAVAALGLGHAIFADFYRDSSTGPIRLALLAPIYTEGPGSRPLGVVALRIDPATYLYSYLSEWPTSSSTAETLLVRRDGNSVLYLNDLKFEQNAALALRMPLIDTQVLAVKAVLGQTGVVEGLDYRGQPVIGYVGAVPSSPWFLVARMDTAEVFAPLRQRLWELLLFFGVLILAAGAGLLLLWRQQGLRYYRAQLESLDALRLSEEKYRSLFNNAEVGMYRTRLDGSEVLDMNDKFLEIFGRTRAELQGTSSVLLWADPQDRQELVRQLEANGRVTDFECQMLNKQGQVRKCLTSVRLFPESGILEGSMLDITERQQAEEKLLASETRYRRLFEAARDGILILDAGTGVVMDVNPFLVEMLGFPRAEILGKELWELGFFKDIAANKANFLELQQKEYVRYENLPLETADGRRFHVEFVSNVYQVDHRKVVQCNIRDITARKQTETRLAQLAAIVDYSEDGIIGKTLDGIITSWNLGAEHLYGYSAAEAVGKPISMLIPPERSDELPEILARVSQGESIRHYETMRQREDGTCLDVSITVSPIKDASGKIIGASTIARDITDRKKIEETLRISRAELDAALASMTDAVFISDAEGNFINFNEAFATFHKFKNKVECAKTLAEYPEFLDVFMPDGRLAPLDMWAVPRALRGEMGTNVEYGLRRKDTRETWEGSYSFAPIRDQAGMIVGSVVVGRDITESKQAAQALLAIESRYRDLVQNANSVILRWSKDGSILFFNEYAQTFFGYTAEEVLGQSVNILLPKTESTGADLTGLVQDILEHPESFINQVNENVCRDGRRVWVAWTNKPILDENGRVSEILAVGIDITDRKQAEQALQESEARYRHALDDMLEGCQIIGHDWRYLYLNDIADVHNRRPKRELLGQRYMDIWPGIESTRVFAVLRQCMEERTPQSMENEFVFPDGRSGWFDLKIYPVPEGIVILSIDITASKQAMRALQTASQRFQVILSSLTGGILVVGLDNRVEFANQAFSDLFDLDDLPEQLLGLPAPEIIQRIASIYADPSQSLARIQEIVAQGQPVQGEEIAITGGRTYIRDFIPILVDGKLYGRIWHHLDITERKQSENMLQARLRLGEFAANHTLAELLRQTLDEVCAITGSPIGFYDFVEPDQKTLSHQTWSSRTLQEYCQATGSGEHFTIEDAGVWVDAIRQRKAVIHNDYAALPHRKGLPAGHAPLIRELVAPVFRNDRIVAILGVGNRAQEYTEKDIEVVTFFADVAWEIAIRKQAEETLRESESRFHSLFENMLNGFAYCRMLVEAGQPLDFIYLDVNHAFEALTGLREVVGKKASEAIPGIQASDSKLLERYARVSLTGLSESFETYVEAMKMWFFISVYSPQKGYFVAVFDVITDRKRAEQELQAYSEYLEEMVNDRTRALQEAQEKMIRQERLATLGQLAGSVGHELRNPLGVISNAVYFLKMTQPGASETILEYLDIIEKETKTSDKIVTDLLDFTRIKSVEREPAAVSDLLAQTLKRYPPPASVEVQLNLPEDLPQLYADSRQVIQVLGNLVTNACQAMLEPRAGSSTLTVPGELPGAGKLTLSARLQGDMIAVAIQDTGVGIPPENMSKLFEPLFTTKTKGIGLGLAVSQKLTEANGGRIEAHSEPGKGSTFTVYLPVYRP